MVSSLLALVLGLGIFGMSTCFFYSRRFLCISWSYFLSCNSSGEIEGSSFYSEGRSLSVLSFLALLNRFTASSWMSILIPLVANGPAYSDLGELYLLEELFLFIPLEATSDFSVPTTLSFFFCLIILFTRLTLFCLACFSLSSPINSFRQHTTIFHSFLLLLLRLRNYPWLSFLQWSGI